MKWMKPVTSLKAGLF